MQKLSRRSVSEVFVVLNIATITFVKLFKENSFDLIPDEYEQGIKGITSDIKNMTRYVFWFVINTLKRGLKEDEDTLFMSIQTTKLSSTTHLFSSQTLLKDKVALLLNIKRRCLCWTSILTLTSILRCLSRMLTVRLRIR